MSADFGRDAKHDLGWVVAWATREAIRYPWPTLAVCSVTGLYVVVRSHGSRRPVVAEAAVATGRGGGPFLAAGVAVACALAYGLWRVAQPSKIVAAIPKPAVTQRTVIEHTITHVVTHTGFSGWEVYGVVAIVTLIVFMVLSLNGRLGGGSDG